jgi:hypothetical protein
MTLDEALMELAHARQQYHMLSNKAQKLIGQVDELTYQLEGETARNIALATGGRHVAGSASRIGRAL